MSKACDFLISGDSVVFKSPKFTVKKSCKSTCVNTELKKTALEDIKGFVIFIYRQYLKDPDQDLLFEFDQRYCILTISDFNVVFWNGANTFSFTNPTEDFLNIVRSFNESN